MRGCEGGTDDGCVRKRRRCGCDGEDGVPVAAALVAALGQALRASGSTVSRAEVLRFASYVEQSKRHRQARRRWWSTQRLADRKEDILSLIVTARDAGDRDEALWLSFVAAHFGRESADRSVDGQVETAARFVHAFRTETHWTWKRVSQEPQSLHCWLVEHRDDLKKLSFGNHRKYESKKPERLWEVMESFIALVREHGGSPSTLFETAAAMPPTQRHKELYDRLRPLWRFDRTGRFDFLSLLNELGLVSVEPSSCYIAGSTGPKEGAKRLWGREKMPRDLGRLADDLAARLRLSPLVVEDALCNWQKD